MHGVNFRRAMRISSQAGAVRALALAVLVSAAPAITLSAQSDGEETTSSLGRNAAHEVRISRAMPGAESIELSARLEDNGGLIKRPIFWTVQGADGLNVYEAETDIAGFSAAPGDYRITARYGTVTVTRELALLKGQTVGVTFVLNAGGVRVLPRVNGVALPELKPQTDIFLGAERIARSTQPGEIVRVGAGAYRVVSHFAHGNAVAEERVVVKPGKMRALTFDHKAGVVTLALTGAAKDAAWRIMDAKGDALPPALGPFALFVLKPGRYVARVTAGGKEHETSFTIGLGETRAITLGD